MVDLTFQVRSRAIAWIEFVLETARLQRWFRGMHAWHDQGFVELEMERAEDPFARKYYFIRKANSPSELRRTKWKNSKETFFLFRFFGILLL